MRRRDALEALLTWLRESARSNDAIAREIIADPTSEQNRRQMQTGLATAGWRRRFF